MKVPERTTSFCRGAKYQKSRVILLAGMCTWYVYVVKQTNGICNKEVIERLHPVWVYLLNLQPKANVLPMSNADPLLFKYNRLLFKMNEE